MKKQYKAVFSAAAIAAATVITFFRHTPSAAGCGLIQQ